jgi:hypothetical protein
MDFVENNKLHVTYQIRTLIQHAAQNLSRHDEATGLRVNLYVSGKNTDRCSAEGLLKVAELLIRQRLDRRGIDGPVFFLVVQ